MLANARQALSDGDTENAATGYAKIIRKGKIVEEILADLEEALRRHPIDVNLWQALGDAYSRLDRLQDAMDAYSKAEDLLT